MRLNTNKWVFITVSIMFVFPLRADNTELMKKQAEHLLEVNRQVLESLPDLPNNSQIRLNADVVQRQGRTEVKVNSVEISALAPDATTESAVREEEIALTGNKASSFVRYSPISTGPDTADEEAPAPDTTGGGAVELQNFLAAHTKLKAVQMDAETLKKLGVEDVPNSGSVMIIWEKSK